jgi:hypothetical protein
MKIYINSNFEIKAINQSEDNSLNEIEIDREQVFGDKSDFMILNYCYQPSENGYSVYPAMDYSVLKLLDTQIANKISILECENKALKEELTQIQTSIASLTSLLAVTLEEK